MSLVGAVSGFGILLKCIFDAVVIGTALLHSAVMVEKRDILKSWTALLAIFAFGSSML